MMGWSCWIDGLTMLWIDEINTIMNNGMIGRERVLLIKGLGCTWCWWYLFKVQTAFKKRGVEGQTSRVSTKDSTV